VISPAVPGAFTICLALSPISSAPHPQSLLSPRRRLIIDSILLCIFRFRATFFAAEAGFAKADGPHAQRGDIARPLMS